ncbi:disulfide bond formation protein DsbA [Marivivens niveibacter]|uniref:Disulfide bond formation protein DsbA n=1 Tax=Marivivens niveibacter TaxID=1930667 RepID=A0A251WVY5_9RHOB|nr:DsbA family protein [Marivivens niveibacter]OUD08650.1 disulfide bond formation protein DsbA [Marivivens niveibacter]
MKRLAFALALGLASPALSTDLTAMSDTERDAFRAEIRAYLLDNPEVLMEAIGVLENRQAAAEAAADQQMAINNLDLIQNDPGSWVGGNPDGDITVVEFLDYRCGYCKRAFDEVEQLISTDGNIRLVIKEFPILGEQSTLASQFAVSVLQLHGDDTYKFVHDTLMTMRSDITPDVLSQIASTVGLDPAPIFEHMSSDEVTNVLRTNMELAQRLNISGTPTFVIEDELVRGYVPLDTMIAMVDAQRAD